MTRLGLTLFGGFQARLGVALLPVRLKKARALLAYLALTTGQHHARDQLAALLWSRTSRDQAHNSLRQTLFALRQACAKARPRCLAIDADTVSLEADAVDVDVMRFQHLATVGTDDGLVAACALYAGDLLDGFVLDEPPFDEWLLHERDRLRQLAVGALTTLATRQRTAGAIEAAIQTALRATALDPLQESVHRLLMRLYAEHGQRASALRQYERCAAVLRRELAASPDPATTELYRELVRSPSSVTMPAPPATAAPPFIGRGAELATIEQDLDRARSGCGEVVAILGEAGIGKTRLTEELAAGAVARDCLVLRGRSYETARILPLGVWTDALPLETISDVLEPGDRDAAWWRELGRLFPEARSARARQGAGAGDALRLFEALAQLVSRVAARRPCLLILEDLHWADDMSLRFLSFLARRVGKCPALVLVTARVEELDHGLLSEVFTEIERSVSLRRLRLDALTRAHTDVLVRSLTPRTITGARLSELSDHVWKMSEGNPFVITETLRAAPDGKAGSPQGLRLPERVRDMILVRLRRFSAAARDVVAVASVIGREFSFTVLQRAAGLDAGTAADCIEELTRRQAIRERRDRFDFTHDRIREAVYEDLLLTRRRLLHGAVATALEDVHRDALEPHFAALAVHYQAAQVWDKALVYLRAAGTQAAGRGAYREAVSLFEDALAALSHLPTNAATLEQAVDIRFELRDWVMPMGELSRLRDYLQEALRLATVLGDERRIGLAAGHLAHYSWLSGDPPRAVELAQQTADLAARRDDFTLAVLGNFYLGEACHALGTYRRSVEALGRNVEVLKGERALERFAGPGLVPLQSRCWLAFSLAELGEFRAALVIAEEAHRVAESVEHPYSLAFAKTALGRLHLARGDPARAIPLLEAGLALIEGRGIALNRPGTLSLLGHAYMLRGREREGLRLLMEAVEQDAMMRRSGRALLLARLAEAHAMRGRVAEARRAARQAVEAAREQKEHGHRGWSLRTLADCCGAGSLPDVDEARRSYAAAMAVADDLEMQPLRAHCLLGLGRLARRVGDADDAQRDLDAAARLFREMDARPIVPGDASGTTAG